MIRILVLSLAALLLPFGAAAENGVLIGPNQIAALAAAELDRRDASARHEIVLAGAPSFRVPADAGAPEIVSIDHQPRTGAFSMLVAPYLGAAPVRVTGRAEALVDAPVLARTVPAGERIMASDIVWTEMRAARLPAGAMLDPAQIEGQEAARTLRAGAALRRHDVKIPSVITRNQQVTVFYTRPGLTLAARGRALEDAAEGASLRILNLQSNRVIEAVAEAPGRARVESPRIYAARNGAWQ